MGSRFGIEDVGADLRDWKANDVDARIVEDWVRVSLGRVPWMIGIASVTTVQRLGIGSGEGRVHIASK